MKEMILNYVDDLVTSFLYYDRKEDEDLPLNAIQEAVRNGEITAEDISAKFAESLKKGLGQ